MICFCFRLYVSSYLVQINQGSSLHSKPKRAPGMLTAAVRQHIRLSLHPLSEIACSCSPLTEQAPSVPPAETGDHGILLPPLHVENTQREDNRAHFEMVMHVVELIFSLVAFNNYCNFHFFLETCHFRDLYFGEISSF